MAEGLYPIEWVKLADKPDPTEPNCTYHAAAKAALQVKWTRSPSSEELVSFEKFLREQLLPPPDPFLALRKLTSTQRELLFLSMMKSHLENNPTIAQQLGVIL